MNRKRMSFVLALAAVVILAALGWLLPWSKNSQAAPAPAPDASFKGKLLLVNTDNIMLCPHFLLEKAQVQKIGEHSWLTGKSVAEGPIGDLHKGRIVRLQTCHIVSITEFDDISDAKKAFKSAVTPLVQPAVGGGTAYSAPLPSSPPATTPPAAGVQSLPDLSRSK